jgi:hypothetical protein
VPSRAPDASRWTTWLEPPATDVERPVDAEGRAIDDRMLAMLLARDADARHRFVTRFVGNEWQEAAFVGNWYVDLTPREADELGRRLFLIVDELRRRAGIVTRGRADARVGERPAAAPRPRSKRP